MTKFIQFELWKDCKQGCKFCFNRGQRPVNKEKSLKYVLDQLNQMEPEQYDYIALIGGELFNGEIDDYLYTFFAIMKRIKELKPQKVFLMTSLIFDIGKTLIPVMKGLEKILDMRDMVVLCTSWDKCWRFGEGDQALWSKNMLWLANHYPEVELHVEMIMTQHLIDAVNNDELNLSLFQQIFRCSVDFIEPSTGLWFKNKHDMQNQLPGFFPTKSSFVKFLDKVKDILDLETFLSMEVRSDELHYYEDGILSVAKNRRANAGVCELRDKSRKYELGFIDSDVPMRSVVEAYLDLTRE